MLLKNIELINIGPYEGTNKFTFNTNDNRNTILIGGKNGSGKTTFLNSVRLALYGPLAYGFKTPTQGYLSKIESLLNNKAKSEKSTKNFSIKIGFTMVEDFKRINIEIIRRWIPSKSTIKEIVEIKRDRVPLNEIEKGNFLEKLRVSFPPSLLELCFFDGEDISKLSNEENLSDYLRELSEKLFNLDLFSSLEQNLKRYLSESTQSNRELQLEDDKNEIELDLKTRLNNLEELKIKIEVLTDKLNNTKDNYIQTKEEFSTHGGLLFDERERIQKEILMIENKRKQVNDNIREFIAHELPFFLSFPVLDNLVKQLDDEENYYISSIIDEKLNQISVKEIENELGISIDAKKEQVLRKVLKNKLVHSNDIDIIHNASKTETHQVHSLLLSVNKNRLNEINKLIETNKDDLSKLSLLNKKLKDNESTSEFNEMILSMENNSKEISILETEIMNLSELQEQLLDEVDKITKQYEKVKKELHNIYKKKSSYDVTKKVLTISEKFQKSQLIKKVRDIEYFSTKMIKELLRKKSFIKRIYIDHETFKITLIDYDNNSINKDILSAGEKELLVLSIIWGTIHSSKKQLPFVLDTLLGRLDLEHKSSVIKELIPKFGKQIIILSTNSEITEDLFEDLSPYITNQYTLTYDNNNKKTIIENHFFNQKVKEVHA